MFGMGNKQPYVVQHSRGTQNARVFLRQLMEVLELVENVQRQLAHMLGMRRIVEVFLTNLFQRLGPVRLRMLGS